MKRYLAIAVVTAAALAGAVSAAAQTKQRPKAPAPNGAAATQQTPVPAEGPRFAPREKVSVAYGEKIFVEYCAVCHGLQGKGDGPRSAFFVQTQYIPDLTVDGFLDGRDGELLTNIRDGLARYDEPAIVMPQFKYILGDVEMRSVVEYIKTLTVRRKRR